MSGIDIMKELKAAHPRTRTIVISGENLTGDIKKVVDENAVLFLEKPFDLEQVKNFTDLIRKVDGASRTAGGAERLVSGSGAETPCPQASDKLVLYTAVAPGGEAKAINLGASLRDISDSGMRLCAYSPLEPGCWVSLSDGSMINEGVVRWSRAAQKEGIYHIGVQFTLVAR